MRTLLAAAAAFLTLAACGAPAGDLTGNLGPPEVVEATSPEIPSEETDEPEPVAAPKPKDFAITIKILEKTCFGSAGCNLTYRIKPSYSGPDLPADQAFEVIYEVRGGENSPQINSFTVTGDDAQFDREEYTGTTSSSVKLAAKATEVLR